MIKLYQEAQLQVIKIYKNTESEFELLTRFASHYIVEGTNFEHQVDKIAGTIVVFWGVGRWVNDKSD